MSVKGIVQHFLEICSPWSRPCRLVKKQWFCCCLCYRPLASLPRVKWEDWYVLMSIYDAAAKSRLAHCSIKLTLWHSQLFPLPRTPDRHKLDHWPFHMYLFQACPNWHLTLDRRSKQSTYFMALLIKKTRLIVPFYWTYFLREVTLPAVHKLWKIIKDDIYLQST